MKHNVYYWWLVGAVALTGCMSSPNPARNSEASSPEPGLSALLEKPFVFAVLRHVYRWHFDQSHVLEAGGVETLEVWARRLHPRLDAEDKSEFAELWIPALNTRVELKRSDYAIPEMNLAVVDRSFKIRSVTRQLRPPVSRPSYQAGRYARAELQDYLFTTRTNVVTMSDALRTTARNLVFQYLNKAHPTPFTEEQILYVAPISTVCNDLWAFWETGRKVMLFSADMDLSNPGFDQLSQLRLQVIDLDKDIVASTKEVPGSNAFVTKDWVGRLFFNCILYGERIAQSPEEMNRIRASFRR